MAIEKHYRHVTKTGRALSPGKVTRKSLSVRRVHRKGDRPLPVHLQCHPKALTPTTRNPGCVTIKNPSGGRLKDFARWRYSMFVRGDGLSPKGRYLVYTKSGKTIGACDDIYYVLAWRTAAATKGVIVTIGDSE